MRKIQRNLFLPKVLMQNEIPNDVLRLKKDKERTVNEKLKAVSYC